MNYYQLLYYNFVRIWKNKKDEIENAPINGIIMITFVLFANLVSIPLIIMAIFGASFFTFPTFNKWYIVPFLIVFGFSNYWILARKRKLEEIEKKFDQLENKIRQKTFRLTIIYLIASLMIPILILLFVPPRL
jgi:hypothetical protein